MVNDSYQDLQAIANVLHSVLSLYPDADMLTTFTSEKIWEEWPKLLNSEQEDKGLMLLKSYLEKYSHSEQELLDLKLDYGRLFFGPGIPFAPPWGSGYLSPSQILNDASTMKLRSFYQSHGINLTMKSNEPIDHIGLIMSVVAFLLGKLVINSSDTYVRQTLVELLNEHMLPWTDRCLALAEQHAKTDFYHGMTILSRVYLTYLSQTFECSPAQLRLYR